MSPQGREPLPERGTGGEIAADKLEPEVFEDRPPRVEVPPALLQETNGASRQSFTFAASSPWVILIALRCFLSSQPSLKSAGTLRKTGGSMGRNRQEV